MAVHSGRFIFIAKADWGTRKLHELFRYIACNCYLEVVVNGSSTVLIWGQKVLHSQKGHMQVTACNGTVSVPV